MTAKYFCDGCDDEIRSFSEQENCFNTLVTKDSHTIVHQIFHLCYSCQRTFEININPTKWVRNAKVQYYKKPPNQDYCK